MKILLVEDEKDLSAAIKKVLTLNNYVVDTAFDGEEALFFAQNSEYDGMVLDVMMPKKNGFEVIKELRARKNAIPVLMLTAKAEIDDKVMGLDCGADDYLTKPFAVKELLARIRALTRRKSDTLVSFSFGNVILKPDTFEIATSVSSARLTNKEFALMEYLVKNNNVLLSTEKIFQNVWDFETESELNVVWVFISSLRKKLKQIEANCTITATRGVGYRLEEIK